MPAVPAHVDVSWPDELLELLSEQQRLVTDLAALAVEQSACISAGRTDALLGVLAQRQRIIDRVVARQEEFAALTTGLESRLGHATAEQRQRIRSLVDSIASGLARVLAIDETDQRELQAARDRTKHEIGGLGSARQARQAYLKGGPVDTRFADERG
jgi:hypothetical protein